MISTSRGIVFHQIKYSETSIIAKIYTEKFGIQSYMIKGARRKKSKATAGNLQHLSLVEVTANHKEKSNIHHLNEIRPFYQYTSIPFEINKSSILLFLNEILYRSIREEETNPELFDFLVNSLQWLDLSLEGYANFHLVFLLQFSRYLGFFPKGNYSDHNYLFDLEGGSFGPKIPIHPNYIKEKTAKQFDDLLKASFENMVNIKLNNSSRNTILETIVQYYQLHVPDLGQLKSLKVLREVFS